MKKEKTTNVEKQPKTFYIVDQSNNLNEGEAEYIGIGLTVEDAVKDFQKEFGCDYEGKMFLFKASLVGELKKKFDVIK